MTPHRLNVNTEPGYCKLFLKWLKNGTSHSWHAFLNYTNVLLSISILPFLIHFFADKPQLTKQLLNSLQISKCVLPTFLEVNTWYTYSGTSPATSFHFSRKDGKHADDIAQLPRFQHHFSSSSPIIFPCIQLFSSMIFPHLPQLSTFLSHHEILNLLWAQPHLLQPLNSVSMQYLHSHSTPPPRNLQPHCHLSRTQQAGFSKMYVYCE